MKKSLCDITLRRARIDPTDCRVAVLQCILKHARPFCLTDIQQCTLQSGKLINRSTLTNILLLFRSRKIIDVDHHQKSEGRGRPIVFYKLV